MLQSEWYRLLADYPSNFPDHWSDFRNTRRGTRLTKERVTRLRRRRQQEAQARQVLLQRRGQGINASNQSAWRSSGDMT